MTGDAEKTTSRPIRRLLAGTALVTLFLLLSWPVASQAIEYAKDCVTESDCPTDKTTFRTEPSLCPAGKGYCYAKAEMIPLNVHVGRMTEVQNIGAYISNFYTFGIGVAMLLAVVMMMIGGVRYLVAGGDASAVTKAKGNISDAIMGLVLALGSYLILNTINPQILKLTVGDIRYIKPVVIQQPARASSCMGYQNRDACIADADHVGGATSCFWAADIGGPHMCATLDTTGTNEKLCSPGKVCNEGLACINTYYSGGGGLMDVCTDGKSGSPCKSSSDCKEENMKCSEGYHCTKASGKAVGENCMTSSECDSHICDTRSYSSEGAKCVSGTEDTECYDKLHSKYVDAVCADGYFCDPDGGSCSNATKDLGESCTSDRQCKSGNCGFFASKCK